MSKREFMARAAIEVLGHDDFTIKAGEVCIEDGPDLVPVAASTQYQIDAKAQELSEQPVVVRVGAFRDFIKMFTESEQLAIVSATISNPQIKLWYDKAMGGATFSLDHPDTAAGLSDLVSVGLLTQERRDAIIQDGDFNSV